MAGADPYARERIYDPEAIRNRLRQERLTRGLSIKEWAAFLGLNQWSVYKKEGGGVDWQTTDFIAIGKAIPDCPTLYPLLDWELAATIDRKVFGK